MLPHARLALCCGLVSGFIGCAASKPLPPAPKPAAAPALLDPVTACQRAPTPRLAARLAELAQAERNIAVVKSLMPFERARAEALGELPDYSSIDRAAFVAMRQRELARRAALAECSDDGSRDQSPAWKEDMIARVPLLRDTILPCLRAELDRARPGALDAGFTLEMKVHIGPDGHVVLAGPNAPYPIPGTREHPFSSDLEYCVTRVVELWTFAPPVGKAIVVLPFVHAPASVGGQAP